MHIFISRAPDRHRRTIKKLRLDYPGVFKKYQNSLLRFAKSIGIAAKANIEKLAAVFGKLEKILSWESRQNGFSFNPS